MSYSRSCYLFLAGLFVVFFSLVLFNVIKGQGGVLKKIVYCASPLIVAVVLGVIVFCSNGRAKQEILSMKNVTEFASVEITYRSWQWKTAFDIWQNHAIYGVGADGGRYIQRFYLPKNQRFITKIHGKANVHSDYFQYLSELGVVGFSILALFFIFLINRVLNIEIINNQFNKMLGATLLCTLAHATFDLPFRSTAIAALWVALLSVLGHFNNKTKSRQEVVSSRPRLAICLRFLVTLTVIVTLAWLVGYPLRATIAKDLLNATQETADHPPLKKLLVANVLCGGEDDLHRVINKRYKAQIENNGATAKDQVAALYWANKLYQQGEDSIDHALYYASLLGRFKFFLEEELTLHKAYAGHKENKAIMAALYHFYIRRGAAEKARFFEKYRDIK
ncbi:MAG: O-antigen ligase family protein [Deltaproteobacteria bacterium]|nr:O-antigen ligase family protein [Deltaproteobacteria bacterium]